MAAQPPNIATVDGNPAQSLEDVHRAATVTPAAAEWTNSRHSRWTMSTLRTNGGCGTEGDGGEAVAQARK
jgi:hypothetical protein